MRSHNTQTSDEGHSANHGEITDYAMMQESGFSGRKDFLWPHGLTLSNDEDIQTVHPTIDKMRGFDKEADVPPFAEQSDDVISRDQIIEVAMRGVFRPGKVCEYERERVAEYISLAAQQQENLYDYRFHMHERLGSCCIGGSNGYSYRTEEDSDTPDFDNGQSHNEYIDDDKQISKR